MNGEGLCRLFVFEITRKTGEDVAPYLYGVTHCSNELVIHAQKGNPLLDIVSRKLIVHFFSCGRTIILRRI